MNKFPDVNNDKEAIIRTIKSFAHNLSDEEAWEIYVKTLVDEKIAPGTQGDFEIELMSNENMEYEINIESYNRKPDNLVFFIKGNEKEFKNLDELEEKLKRKVKE